MAQFNDKTKLEQVMKANHFLEFAKNALITHFQIWVNDLLFLSLYSEQKTARVVAKYLHGPLQPQAAEAPATEEYESTIHGRTIHLTKFEAFLKENCVKRDVIKTTSHVEPYDDEIRILATTDHDMWSNTAPPLLSSFKDQYCVKYAALPSNLHKGE